MPLPVSFDMPTNQQLVRFVRWSHGFVWPDCECYNRTAATSAPTSALVKRVLVALICCWQLNLLNRQLETWLTWMRDGQRRSATDSDALRWIVAPKERANEVLWERYTPHTVVITVAVGRKTIKIEKICVCLSATSFYCSVLLIMIFSLFSLTPLDASDAYGRLAHTHTHTWDQEWVWGFFWRSF